MAWCAAMTAVTGWGEALGAHCVAIAEVEREFKLAPGKIARGAGIESIARVGRGEDEVTLGARAAEAALHRAGVGISELDCVLATSETYERYPSLAPALHAELLAEANCGAMDVGGGCAGLLNALAAARGMLLTGAARAVLIVTADVHSRVLTPKEVKGEFGALFGDGASAFVLCGVGAGLQTGPSSHEQRADLKIGPYCVGEVSLGCAAGLANAIRLKRDAHGKLDLHFQGPALARGAVGLLCETIERVAARGGVEHHVAAAFATHQPNPRLVETLARELEVTPEKFPAVARTCGNLGSSTCGVALARALDEAAKKPANERGPIFVASLGPGILWGGTVLTISGSKSEIQKP